MSDFQVVGIDTDDGNVTILQDFDNSGEARAFMWRFVRSEDAGGWDRLEVLDTRDECAETIWCWNREDYLGN